MEAMLSDKGGGSENDGENIANLGDDHYFLDHICTDDHILSEAFIYSGQLDFFITQSPKGMKTVSTGLFLTTLSLGFFVSSFLVMVVKRVTGSDGGQGWLANKINSGSLDCFYGLLAILGVMNFVVFLVCALWYKPSNTNIKSGSQTENVGNGSLAEEQC
ncbi:hypothetical protein GH714_016002 [Hevea brasiliensis]|uniref:Uncharacterized protein n=1 Tax=Hevea brasiliensis TaxID=3981 RepID=A0A6A6ME26_HEVBR|nr:hypothetical protein GH714_016002 [Hevea brasiliensis]